MLQDLALPHYHHELVKAAVELLFEYPDKAGPLSGLLKQLSEQGVITSTQMAQVCDACWGQCDGWRVSVTSGVVV